MPRERTRLQGGFEMLVLSRKEGERLVIGDNITLVISKISGNRVTIGIEAPKEVKIVRSELQSEDEPITTIVKPDANRPKALKDFAGAVLTLKRQVG
jgi:carbon storage regulator